MGVRCVEHGRAPPFGPEAGVAHEGVQGPQRPEVSVPPHRVARPATAPPPQVPRTRPTQLADHELPARLQDTSELTDGRARLGDEAEDGEAHGLIEGRRGERELRDISADHAHTRVGRFVFRSSVGQHGPGSVHRGDPGALRRELERESSVSGARVEDVSTSYGSQDVEERPALVRPNPSTQGRVEPSSVSLRRGRVIERLAVRGRATHVLGCRDHGAFACGGSAGSGDEDNVSGMRTITKTVESNTSPPTTATAGAMPNRSASTPATMAPNA